MADNAGKRILGRNRKARHEYEILETFEAGIALKGPEVKSIRAGKIGFQDGHARIERGEVWLHGLHVSPYEPATRWNEDPLRARKVLLHRHQIRRLVGKVEERGLTLVPLELYLKNGLVKVTLALARGRKTHDKREKLRRETQEREARRAMEARRS
jgi:SsrA-binding protein